jgi:methionine synthase I (cobalamin-dependent)
MDGAMGTELRRAGIMVDRCGDLCNLTQPERVRDIHLRYKDAGAHCLLTNTFQSNPSALAQHRAAEKLAEINHAAVEIARSVAGRDGFVLGDIGPLKPPWQEEPVRQVVSSLAGVDGILFETFSDMDALWAIKYGCLSVLEGSDVPVLLSIAYKRTPEGVLTSHAGQPPEVFARLAKEYGVACLGLNCGLDIGMGEAIEIIKRYRAVTDLPLFARPNAGTPTMENGKATYPGAPAGMASVLPELLAAGVAMVGGCCGTTPEHIAAFRAIVDSWNARPAPGEYI